MRKMNEKLTNIVGMEKLKEELVQLASNRMADLKREELGLFIRMKRPVFVFTCNPGCLKISIESIVSGIHWRNAKLNKSVNHDVSCYFRIFI